MHIREHTHVRAETEHEALQTPQKHFVNDISTLEKFHIYSLLRTSSERCIVGPWSSPSWGLTFNTQAWEWTLFDLSRGIQNRDRRRAHVRAVAPDLGRAEDPTGRLHRLCYLPCQSDTRLCLATVHTMPLFDVPGWNVSGAPVTESQPSKKRKRGRDEDKVQSAEINFEKLMEKLDAQASGADHPSKKKKKPKPQRSAAGSNVHNKMAHTRQDGAEPKQKRIERKQKATTPRGASAVQSESGLSEKKGKKSKVEHAKLADSQHVPNPNVHGRDHEPKDGLTVLQAGMKNSLDGARFRYPKLFSCPSLVSKHAQMDQRSAVQVR